MRKYLYNFQNNKSLCLTNLVTFFSYFSNWSPLYSQIRRFIQFYGLTTLSSLFRLWDHHNHLSFAEHKLLHNYFIVISHAICL